MEVLKIAASIGLVALDIALIRFFFPPGLDMFRDGNHEEEPVFRNMFSMAAGLTLSVPVLAVTLTALALWDIWS